MCFYIRVSQFHLPQKSEPVIMIGPGTGIAPFRSFWQQKICDNIGNGKKRNDMTMFFGCRHPRHDNIYAKELQEAKNIGVLTNVLTAYSRQPNQPKVSSIKLILKRLEGEFDPPTSRGLFFFLLLILSKDAFFLKDSLKFIKLSSCSEDMRIFFSNFSYFC